MVIESVRQLGSETSNGREAPLEAQQQQDGPASQQQKQSCSQDADEKALVRSEQAQDACRRTSYSESEPSLDADLDSDEYEARSSENRSRRFHSESSPANRADDFSDAESQEQD